MLSEACRYTIEQHVRGRRLRTLPRTSYRSVLPFLHRSGHPWHVYALSALMSCGCTLSHPGECDWTICARRPGVSCPKNWIDQHTLRRRTAVRPTIHVNTIEQSVRGPARGHCSAKTAEPIEVLLSVTQIFPDDKHVNSLTTFYYCYVWLFDSSEGSVQTRLRNAEILNYCFITRHC